MKKITIAVAGNPNVGKSTLFNAFTGARQHVGNWPGKTIEKKEGELRHEGHNIKIVDLPGTYSLTAYSIEEIVARNYIVDEHPDAVIHIVDSTNLERNLYLTLQLIELGANVVLALNMTDLAEKQKIEIDEKKISHFLNIPVVKIQARKKQGIDKLIKVTIEEAGKKRHKKPQMRYGKELRPHIIELGDIAKKLNLSEGYNPRWIVLKLLECDDQVRSLVEKIDGGKELIEEVRKTRVHLVHIFGEDVDTVLANARYGFIAGLMKESVNKKAEGQLTISDKIDRFVTNRYLGIPFFLFVMWLMFTITFEVAAPFMDLIDWSFGWMSGIAVGWVASVNGPEWLASLIADGIMGGVGSVLIFVPNIFLLFMVIAILEDSGYMARAAFIMDRLMHKIGLHGKSFIPMILGFGCNVPAIMATRTLENKKDRLLTILINPLMSCSARLPVYVLFVGAFFAEYQGLVIFSLYLLGITLAILMGLIFKKSLFPGLSSPFVMELPPYRMPTLTGILVHMWERGSLFIKKAGTMIFVIVLFIWFLANLPMGVEYASQESLIGQMGSLIAPIFEPCGFGSWQASSSLLFGFAAKEVVVGTLGTVYGVGEEALVDSLRNTFTPLSAYAFMVFTLLYVPCMAVISVIKKETNSWKWPIFTVVYTTLLAWVVSFIVYQGGLLLGFT
ncbi:ferrous iron transport protein B [Candidatus Micrarchaeota archaeon]|nr:ferrous iron transport protein B [Candidatus Micrarchaeota archaeon]